MQEKLKVKMPFKRALKEKEVLIKCVRSDNEKSSEQETVVIEDGEITYTDTVSKKRRKDSVMTINLCDLIPDGSIKTSSIKLSLKQDATVELQFKYFPSND